MLPILIIVLWLGWLGIRAYLRRNDPNGLALLTGEAEVTRSGRIVRPAQDLAYRQEMLGSPLPQGDATAMPPAVGALIPANPAAFGSIPGYDRRRAQRRLVGREVQSAGERRAGRDRRSA